MARYKQTARRADVGRPRNTAPLLIPPQERSRRQQAARSAPQRRTVPRPRVDAAEDTEMDSDNITAISEASDSDEPTAAKKSKTSAPITKRSLTQRSERPTRSMTGPQRARVIPPSQSPSGSSSALSSVRGHSMEDETPRTSVAVTPAESLSKVESSATLKNFSRGNRSIPTGTQNKRKHEDFLKDALLAQSLQEAEYQDEPTCPPIARGRKKVAIEDSEDDELVLSSEGEEEPLKTDLQPSKRRKVGRSLSRPTRIAREKAISSLSKNAPKEIVDTDPEDSDLSEYDTDDVDESEDSDDAISVSNPIVPQDTSTPAAPIPPIPPIPPTYRGRQRGSTRATRRMAQFYTINGARTTRAERERMKLIAAHPEISTMWDALKNIPVIVPNQAKQPEAITRKLKSFQLEGLDWMMKQEKSQWKGGLLGDEMGMGKTIQAVSLIMSDYPAKDPTLVVVPPVALMQWQNEIKEYTSGKLKVLVYHNTNPKIKSMKMAELKSYDVIMISYSGLESIHRKESKGWKRDDGIVKENSRIHAINYHRLILDEAHNIKTRTTGVAKACFALKADYKWCLSGTPVQNRIGEFFSLLRFLQVKPFACYFCKACACATLHWSQDAEKKCTECSHSGFSHVSVFNQELLNPITQTDNPEVRKAALDKLRLVTDRIMLRRIKRDHTASMELPPKEVIIHNEFFGDIERDFSSSIMSNTTRQFDTYVSRGVMLNNYANIFGLIMQMRQVANHPDLILKKHAQGGQNVLVCRICDETAEEPIRSRCHHEFCRKCAKDYVKSFHDATPDCPQCHIPLAIDFDQPDIEQDENYVKKSSIINRIKMEDWTSSTKIEMLVYDLYKLRSPKQTNKSIVFSQFTSMLQLVEWRLRRAGFKTVMLDGSMSPAQRQRSIEFFMNNTDVEVFLVSLKAGGVALNLTEASRVFIIDPWWNPAAEWQSADRCHRIGQKRPCVITRLCIEDSVESRMIMLQEKKAHMINGTINNDQVAMEKLTPEDMQFLFRGN